MGRRLNSLIASVALVAGTVAALPAQAKQAPAQPTAVPDVVQIEDPFGDANFLGGDRVTPADGGSQTDIGKVWFSQDATTFQVHVLTEGAPTATSFGFLFEVTAGEAGCLVFEGFTKGTSYLSDNLGRVTDGCNGLDRLAEGTSMVFAAGPNGEGGLATITVPRAYSPLFAAGSTLTAPIAETRIFAGGEQITPSGYRGVGQLVDNTKAGTDYVVVDEGAPAEPKPPAKPGKPKPGKGKPKGCTNGNGKKKGCKPAPPAPAACPAYTPGELGKDKPTVKLTDAATEAAPVEQKVSLGMSVADLGFGIVPAQGPFAETNDYFNVQVDSANPEAGVYMLIEFPERRDYDLDLLHPDGSYGARSHDWNTVLGTGQGANGGHGGEATTASEKLVGIRTADCGGWTVETTNWFGEGGEITVKMWLGEAVNDPQAPGDEPRA